MAVMRACATEMVVMMAKVLGYLKKYNTDNYNSNENNMIMMIIIIMSNLYKDNIFSKYVLKLLFIWTMKQVKLTYFTDTTLNKFKALTHFFFRPLI